MTGDSVPMHGDARSVEAGDAFSWSVRPSDKAPGKLVVVLAVAMVAAAFGYLLFGNVFMAVLAFAIIAGSTAEFWLGARYKVDAKGATARVGLSVSAIEWENVKRAIVSEDQVKLSPLSREGRMDPFRGVTLRFGDHREAILGLVRRYGGSDVELLGD